MGLEERHSYRFGYLQSEHWQGIRLQKLADTDAKCLYCGHRDLSNDVHHVHYPENLYETELGMLRVLCRPHHTRLHELMEIKKAAYAHLKEEKSRKGIDFAIFRRCSIVIESEMINAGLRPCSIQGRMRKPDEVVEKQRRLKEAKKIEKEREKREAKMNRRLKLSALWKFLKKQDRQMRDLILNDEDDLLVSLPDEIQEKVQAVHLNIQELRVAVREFLEDEIEKGY